MKPILRWHHSRLGRVVLFLGGIRLAVPVLFLVAAALAWGTWIESTRDAGEAGRMVYGAWWFLGLMGLVCMSLVLSVVTRFPWRRKHVGFITVHASLVLLIASAFLSYFTRVEGRIMLAEGESAAALQLARVQVEILRHEAGQFVPESAIEIDDAASFEAAGVSVAIQARWANLTEEFRVSDDGANPLHAIELRPGNGEPVWIGQTTPDQPAQDLDGVFVRVLPEGERWTPAAAAGTTTLDLVTEAGERLTVPAPGKTLSGGWRVRQALRFERATVEGGGLVERAEGPANPAALVDVVHDDGSVERLIAFERFPESVHKKTLAGESHSPYVLRFGATSAPAEPLLTFERIGGASVVIISSGSQVERFERPSEAEWRVDSQMVGGFAVLQEFTRARGGTTLEEAPEAENSRPAIVVSYRQSDHEHTAVLPWMQRVPLQLGNEVRMVRFGPVLHELPFSIELADFRKMDYPGSDMAMAYESDVRFAPIGEEATPATISMNRPLKHAGWKVYQSGFVGDNVSVFQVMRDPGLVPTYIACIGLCIGIVVTFYSRSLSRGHPGVPALFARRTLAQPIEGTNHENASDRDVPLPGSHVQSAGADAAGGDDAVGAAHPAPGAGHAVVHVRTSRRGAAHRAHEVVERQGP